MKQRTVAEHRRCLYCGGHLREEGDRLTRQQRMLMDYLGQQTRPVSAARIAAHMRLRRYSSGYAYKDEIRNVRVVVHYIRQALGKDAILSIPGEGYVLGHKTTA